MNELYFIDKLKEDDFNKGLLKLLEQLTFVDLDKITKDEFIEGISNLSSQVFVIRNLSTDKVIACGSILIEHKIIHKFGKVAHIEDIVVDENYRGMGFGKQMIQHLVDVAKDNGCYKVILNCSQHNIGFYEHCDFTVKGVQMAKYFDK